METRKKPKESIYLDVINKKVLLLDKKFAKEETSFLPITLKQVKHIYNNNNKNVYMCPLSMKLARSI